MIDQNTLAWYGVNFENAFLKAKGDAFQTFFEQLMNRAYKADFIACRPWGNVGDKKNDGFLKSEKRLFQVYAPNEMTRAEAEKKITEDFAGALQHWKGYFDKWTFVHNASDGLPPHIHELLLKTEQGNLGVEIEPWSLEELRTIFRRLELADLQSWFNYTPPTAAEQSSIGFEDIRVVLLDIAARELPADHSVMIVDSGKLRANRLSKDIQILLAAGFSKAPLVKQFFDEWPQPTYGERLAKAFREHYELLRDTTPPFHPNEIFDKLRSWIGGTHDLSSARLASVLAVLAYFFERCDIFEPANPLIP